MDKFTVFGSDGMALVEESKDAYGKALAAWKQAHETPVERIEAAVEAVFDRHPGVRFPMQALVGQAVTELGAMPSQYTALSEAVHTYVRAQSADNKGRIDIGKGKRGGVLRLALPGQPVPERAVKSA